MTTNSATTTASAVIGPASVNSRKKGRFSGIRLGSQWVVRSVSDSNKIRLQAGGFPRRGQCHHMLPLTLKGKVVEHDPHPREPAFQPKSGKGYVP